VVALFELSLHALHDKDGEPISVKQLRKEQQAGGFVEPGSNVMDMRAFVGRLQQSFDNLCDIYIDIVLDRDGQHSAVDQIADQVSNLNIL
jgi:hypothetical protein